MNRKAGVIYWRVLITLFAIVPTMAVGDNALNIGIVKSSDNSYYNKTIETILNVTNSAAHFRIAKIDPDTNRIAGIEDADLIISLGARATNLADAQYPQTNLITAYLTAQQIDSYSLSNRNHTAVLLDQPLLRYLAFSHLLLDTRAIGLIGRDIVELTADEQRFLIGHDIALEQRHIRQNSDLLPVLRRLVRETTSLLMLPDLRIYNRNTLKGVLLTTYRSRTPVISYSPAHVKSGALGSIYSSPENIGQHLGDLLNEFIRSGSLSSRNKQFAKYYTIALNQQVARALNLSLPDEDELRLQLEEVLK